MGQLPHKGKQVAEVDLRISTSPVNTQFYLPNILFSFFGNLYFLFKSAIYIAFLCHYSILHI